MWNTIIIFDNNVIPYILSTLISLNTSINPPGASAKHNALFISSI